MFLFWNKTIELSPVSPWIMLYDTPVGPVPMNEPLALYNLVCNSSFSAIVSSSYFSFVLYLVSIFFSRLVRLYSLSSSSLFYRISKRRFFSLSAASSCYSFSCCSSAGTFWASFLNYSSFLLSASFSRVRDLFDTRSWFMFSADSSSLPSTWKFNWLWLCLKSEICFSLISCNFYWDSFSLF